MTELSEIGFYVSACVLRIPQVLALAPVLVGVPGVISSGPPFNHGPICMTFPRDGLNLSLSEMRTRTPGQPGHGQALRY